VYALLNFVFCVSVGVFDSGGIGYKWCAGIWAVYQKSISVQI